MNALKHLLVAIIAISFLAYIGGPVQASTLQNIEPLSDAGLDQTVDTLAVVNLDGSASSDPDGNVPLTYLWTQTGGSTVELSDPAAVNPSFTAPADPSVLTFSLVVTDSLDLADTTPDEVTITVENQSPAADAGPDQSVLTSSLVTLDGSLSSDPDGDVPLVYLWEQISGPAVELSDGLVATPTFMAPSTEVELTFSLTVTDSLGLAASTPDTVTITVNYARVFLPMILAPFSPASFNKLSPASGATGLSATPTLSWGLTSPVTSYEYCYDTSNDDACSNWLSNGTSTSIVLPPLQGSMTYYWQVRARNASAALTYANDSPTAFWSFTTAVLPPAAFIKTSPVHGASNQSITPTLYWTDTSPVTLYEYCYDTVDDHLCSNWIPNGLSTSVTLPSLQYNTAYFWQVRAWNGSTGPTYADGAFYADYAFVTTLPPLPAAFNKLSPFHGAGSQPLTPTLSWAATSPVTLYEYCYDTVDDHLCSNWISNGLSTSVTLPSLQPNTAYFWQVRAWNGMFGPMYADGASYADYAFVTAPPQSPAAFNKISPSHGASGQSLTPTLTWGSTFPVTRYEYCYDTTDDYTCSNWISTGLSTSVTLPTLLPGTAYFWQVRAYNGDSIPTYADGFSYVTWAFVTESQILNGGFESGRVIWSQYSTHNYYVIYNNSQGLSLLAHTGSWFAVLGGSENEIGSISQTIYIPVGKSILHYWFYGFSSDYCNYYDLFGIFIGETVVHGEVLCDSYDTHGWVHRTLDLSAYAGTTQTLEFLVGTDLTLASFVALDDIYLGSSFSSSQAHDQSPIDNLLPTGKWLESLTIFKADLHSKSSGSANKSLNNFSE